VVAATRRTTGNAIRDTSGVEDPIATGIHAAPPSLRLPGPDPAAREVQPVKASDQKKGGDVAKSKKPFLSDIQDIRRRAREHMEAGAVTGGYRADREMVIKLLNEALATEIVCVLRYKRHHFMAQGIHADPIAAEFLEHANEEQQHADQLAQRIVQLGGRPNFSPEGLLSRSHSEYVEGETLVDMIREDLVAERIAIDSYSEMIRYIDDDDPVTKQLLIEILAVEEEHADDLASFLADLDQDWKTRPRRDG
jgi:bacterioferritin